VRGAHTFAEAKNISGGMLSRAMRSLAELK
jgi:hypothetical protein